ncbi:DUF3306 domain-containing protein [Thioalkalivibrio paradoxus]|uniref:DUF3306 domain-containing protein n=1 Tax=Thioalkalivibrio paradoxus ARh 1 TaxID=713585 RepID=W0DJ59_9GAMM|nr:DUF3306 domain-containing protein [Thioalkalivibrio paradoxus]AHE97262.1 hypothetical protein THITH_02130 [Thioalkalivibrio paradoxus ARh 1]
MNRYSGNGNENGGGDDGGFLRRWSRRKAEVRSGVDIEDSEAATSEDSVPDFQATASAATDAAVTPDPAEPELTDADMPSLESLDQDSDYSPFLSPGVSTELRQQALRQLFRQPKFNVETCLEDYQDDYQNFQPLGDIVTCDRRHQAEVEARRKAERQAEESTGQAAADAPIPDSAAGPLPADGQMAGGADLPPSGSEPQATPPPGRPPAAGEPSHGDATRPESAQNHHANAQAGAPRDHRQPTTNQPTTNHRNGNR